MTPIWFATPWTIVAGTYCAFESALPVPSIPSYIVSDMKYVLGARLRLIVQIVELWPGTHPGEFGVRLSSMG